MSENTDAPKIHIDSDWKAQARAEKEKLAEKSKTTGDGKAPGRAAGPGGMPPATIETLISTLATQALYAMGAIADPRTGQRFQHLDLAKHNIDMLGVLEEKTKGNVTEQEADLLAKTAYELRTTYIRLASAGRG
jgi:hypothetical protein